jgi:hypothetical protein
MISSSGAAVGFPGAKADSTGVTGRGSAVGDGGVGEEAAAEGPQAFRVRTRNEIRQTGMRSLCSIKPLIEWVMHSWLTITRAAWNVTLPLNYIQKVIFFLFLFSWNLKIIYNI